jgi:hypothetical protein
MSTLYGSQAIGGVINMVTKAGRPDERRRLHRAQHAAADQQRRVRARQRGAASYNIASPAPIRRTIPSCPALPPGGFVDTDPYRNITVVALG